MSQKLSEKPSLGKKVGPQEIDFSFKELSISILPPTGTYDFGRETGQTRTERREGFDDKRLKGSVSVSEQQMSECGYCTGCTTCTGCTFCTPCTQCTPTGGFNARQSDKPEGLVLGDLRRELEELLVTK